MPRKSPPPARQTREQRVMAARDPANAAIFNGGVNRPCIIVDGAIRLLQGITEAEWNLWLALARLDDTLYRSESDAAVCGHDDTVRPRA